MYRRLRCRASAYFKLNNTVIDLTNSEGSKLLFNGFLILKLVFNCKFNGGVVVLNARALLFNINTVFAN